MHDFEMREMEFGKREMEKDEEIERGWKRQGDTK